MKEGSTAKLRGFVWIVAAAMMGCANDARSTQRTSSAAPRTTRTSAQPIDKVMNEPMHGIVQPR